MAANVRATKMRNVMRMQLTHAALLPSAVRAGLPEGHKVIYVPEATCDTSGDSRDSREVYNESLKLAHHPQLGSGVI
jgi:hypothetical protein